MIGQRMKYLLLEAAKCFDEDYSPFNSEWLSKHEVALDECMNLSELIGTIIKGVALASDATQIEVILVSASDGKVTSENARASIHAVKVKRMLMK